jgi:hypothetical protein
MDKFIIVIFIIAIVYILVLYFRCKDLNNKLSWYEDKLHEAAILISAHKIVAVNKKLAEGDNRDPRNIIREIDNEVNECARFITEHEQELINKNNEDGFIRKGDL